MNIEQGKNFAWHEFRMSLPFDFITRIKKESGGYKNVLIELQKTYLSHDLMRFHRYMGEQYKKEDEVVREDGCVSRGPLPIITIYFLGNKISETLPGVIKVNRTYIDVSGGGKEIEERNDFIECLSHNSYVIQIPPLHLELKTELEIKDKELAQKDRKIKETAKQMLLDGMPVEKVAQYTGLAEKEVKALMH